MRRGYVAGQAYFGAYSRAVVTCPQCATPAPTSESRFCDRCGSALRPPTLNCEVCGRPYKTERGWRAHMASVHGHSDVPAAEGEHAPWQAHGPGDEDGTRTPWLPPPVQPPPRAVPGASSADLPTEATPAPSPAPPPSAEPFRWSRPATDAAETAPPGPPPPQYPNTSQYAAGQYPPPPAGYGVPAAPLPPPDGSRPVPFRSLKDLAGIIGLFFLLEVLALLLGAGANVYLGLTVPPSVDNLDLFRNVDDKQWIAWATAAVFLVCAYVVIVFWLHRAYKNQLALGATTRLSPSVVAVLCLVPVVNLVIMTIALREIWRNADLQRNEWVAKARRSSVPSSINVIWIGPVLAVIAWIVFALVVSDRIGSDGVTSVDDAKFLYFARAVLLFELLWVTLALRRVFSTVTEQQERAQWHYQMGHGLGGPPPPPPPAPTAAYPAVPS